MPVDAGVVWDIVAVFGAVIKESLVFKCYTSKIYLESFEMWCWVKDVEGQLDGSRRRGTFFIQ